MAKDTTYSGERNPFSLAELHDMMDEVYERNTDDDTPYKDYQKKMVAIIDGGAIIDEGTAIKSWMSGARNSWYPPPAAIPDETPKFYRADQFVPSESFDKVAKENEELKKKLAEAEAALEASARAFADAIAEAGWKAVEDGLPELHEKFVGVRIISDGSRNVSVYRFVPWTKHDDITKPHAKVYVSATGEKMKLERMSASGVFFGSMARLEKWKRLGD